MLGRDPFCWVIGVSVVAFQRETVGLDEVLIAPAAILVLGADIIPADSLLQRGGSGDADGLGIHIVGWVAQAVSLVQGKAVGTWHGLPP